MLNDILHQPTRTQIMSILIVKESIDFSSLKKELGVSDGHLGTHIKVLTKHEYISVEKNL